MRNAQLLLALTLLACEDDATQLVISETPGFDAVSTAGDAAATDDDTELAGDTPAAGQDTAGDVADPTCDQPDPCTGRLCGTACGYNCGECADGFVCDQGECWQEGACIPQCEGRSCGDDGCGGVCAPYEAPDGTPVPCDVYYNEHALKLGDEVYSCVEGECECVSQTGCGGKICGVDQCGASCGECDDGFKCSDDSARCLPLACGENCDEVCKPCTADSDCSSGLTCVDGECLARCDPSADEPACPWGGSIACLPQGVCLRPTSCR